ncbi:hypothetical protein CTA1_11549 [Colletotrichum tanaceti]|uniref:Myb-like DNA-binding domain-containing protein n=1 Tax=Colletotrichum tanaceti TaxID=1306861 RepID=A0A4U6XCD5_9PEZI|nr:hypothetical protein CTA1_11549 [Colletotrichum tanaceti]
MSEKTAPIPSQSDINFMVEIFQHMTEKPNIDWDSFANAAGFKSAGVAQTRWGQIKRKFNNSAGPATPKKAAARASSSTPGSSSRVKKSTGRVGGKATKAIKSEKKVEDDSEDEDAVKDEAAAEIKGLKFEGEI